MKVRSKYRKTMTERLEKLRILTFDPDYIELLFGDPKGL